MRFEDEELEQMDKVNHLMDTIHTHADDIYESLMDEGNDNVLLHAQSLIYILRKIIKKHKS